MENFLAKSNAGQLSLSPITDLTSIKFFRLGESSIARKFEPRPETKTETVNTFLLNYLDKTT